MKNLVKKILIDFQTARYKREYRLQKRTYEDWLQDREPASFCGKEEPEFMIFTAPNGELDAGARARIANYFAEHPEVDLVYGDEDVKEGKSFHSPWLKPDWSPDTLESLFYFGGLYAVRASFLDENERAPMPDIESYTALGRTLARKAGGYRKGSCGIGHIPEILYHNASKEKYEEYFASKGEGRMTDSSKEATGEKIAVVIPSKDHPQLVEQCLVHLDEAMGKLPYEVVVVDNGSSAVNRTRLDVVAKAWNTRGVKVTYLYEPMEFHFSKMCNLGARASEGKLLLFLNDDVELTKDSNLAQMADLASREYVGAVGCKLYYPDSKRIQHAGIINLPMGPVHKLQFKIDDRDYYFRYNKEVVDVSAVTAACLMVTREKYEEVKGFTEELPVAFNDVDVCFSLLEKGYYNVCMNDSYAFHHESLSRGEDESEEKYNRLMRERDRLYDRHPSRKGIDPFYSVHLGRECLDTGIHPAWEMGEKAPQEVSQIRRISLNSYRKDPCVMVRLESSVEDVLQGYCMVLGDNNACYEKALILSRRSGQEEKAGLDSDGEVYGIPVEGRLRPDLEENLPDQVNVGLCGYRIKLSRDDLQTELPAGEYEIGMAVRNRVTGLCLYNNTGRYLIA